MRTLALVPVRAGSKGIPHKNTRLFRGLPLLAHAIKCGQETCDRTLVSTDDPDAALIAAQYGASVLQRPPELATDEAPMLAVVQHALKHADADVVILLQPSSPAVRRVEYVREALRILAEEEDSDSVVSVVPIPAHFSPEYAVHIRDGELELWDTRPDLSPGMNHGPTRRQDCAPVYYRDGAVYAIRAHVISDDLLYGDTCLPLMVATSHSVTLDTEADWALGEAKHG